MFSRPNWVSSEIAGLLQTGVGNPALPQPAITLRDVSDGAADAIILERKGNPVQELPYVAGYTLLVLCLWLEVK